jgi:hypothetical protein
MYAFLYIYYLTIRSLAPDVPVSSTMEASVFGMPIPDKKKASAACPQVSSPL